MAHNCARFLKLCGALLKERGLQNGLRSTANFSDWDHLKGASSHTENALPDDHETTVSRRDFIQLHGDWDEESKVKIKNDLLLFDNFITEQEEDSIMSEIGAYLMRMRYECDHWDDAIHGFRETERLHWRPENARVLERVRRRAFSADTLPHVHVLDLSATGVIKPHVDSIRFCGSIIAGLSLLSDAVMRLESTAPPRRRLDVLLQRRSLYVMRHSARYDYTHQVLAASESTFSGRPVPRDRRVSIIFRSQPELGPAPDELGPAPDPHPQPGTERQGVPGPGSKDSWDQSPVAMMYSPPRSEGASPER